MHGIGNQIRFRETGANTSEKKVVTDSEPTLSWPDWRGNHRNGRVSFLPEKLPAQIKPIWEYALSSPGLGGVAANSQYVIVSDRVLTDSMDAFIGLHAATGKVAWTIRYPAKGNLDYGNSPRATPVISGDRVYLFGAFGHLTCANIANGEIFWDMNLNDEFEPSEQPKWGTCSTPLLVGNKLIVNPGAKDASLAALDAKTGKVLWKTPGKAAGYGSLIVATLGGKEQIIGHDTDSLGGWDIDTGKRLWKLTPERASDFNVPTPIAFKNTLIVTTENNGTRQYAFNTDGTIKPTPLATYKRLAPDTHTPVVASNRIFGVWRKLYCVDLDNGMKTVYEEDDTAFQKYCTMVATETRVLVITMMGELILLDAKAKEYEPISRVQTIPGEKGLYAHPAFVGERVYLRGSEKLIAFPLK